MKIREISIENYKNLRNVVLDQVGDLVTLIGTNNAGKTNLLELLNRFFTEIDMTGVPSGIDNYCWYDGDVERDIKITITLELEQQELEEVLPSEALTSIKGRKQPENEINVVTVSRRIVKPPIGWTPQDLKFGDIFIMKDGKIVTPVDFLPIPYELKAVLFSPEASKDNLTGQRIILLRPQKKAYLMGTYADGLMKEGKADVSKVSDQTLDWKEYARNEGYTPMEQELTEAELKSLSARA